MPCPVSSVVGVGAVFGGIHSLLFQDRKWRWLAWASLLGLAAAWLVYFTSMRHQPARIGLEVLSVAALIGAGFRVRWLVKTRTTQPLLYAPLARLFRWVAPVFGSLWIISTKVWLLAMFVMEWRGKAHFSVLEYGIVMCVLAVLIAIRVHSVLRTRASSDFSTLESMAISAPPAVCPLGFGCDTSALPVEEDTRPARPAAVVAGHIAHAYEAADIEPVRQA